MKYATTLALLLAALPAAAAESKPEKPAVEVVFVLDTTGSMGGLIEAAKQKIWAIANEIAKGKPTPEIRMGLIAYRDQGDEYVTKSFDLTKNLDLIYKELLALNAGGGGDGPEHVLKGLEDAVERISWSKERKAFRVVYLVGDAPAHLEYGDTPALEALTQTAVRKGLVLNTIQCGGGNDTAEQWRKIARLGEGRYLAIASDGGVQTAATPFDAGLAALSAKLDGTMLGYGARRGAEREAKSVARKIAAAAPAAAKADRAVYRSRAGFDGESDLAAAVAGGKVKLESLSEEALPDELKGLGEAQRREKIAAINKERAQLSAEIQTLSDKRADYLKKNAGEAPKDAFDGSLLESLKAQAAKKGIAY